jgi:UDP-glucose 4-epimerase
MTLAWVLGARGLLGSAFSRALSLDGARLFAQPERFHWSDESRLASQIEAAVKEFSVSAADVKKWEIYWAAGIGTMSSTMEMLLPETRALERLLDLLRSDRQLMAMAGSIVFSSSAGAIYGACAEEIITEDSPVAPSNAYAREKLKQEGLLKEFGDDNKNITVFVSRISTLYGAGQATAKPQGLLTHIARSIVRNKPISIYVPIDTIRDYISVDDAATRIIETLRGLGGRSGVWLKIIASERPTTIAEIISIFRRIARKSPRITTGASKASGLYLRRVQFRSVVLNEEELSAGRSLTVGIAQLLNSERARYANPER